MSQFICDTATGCTVTVLVEPAPPSAERIQDLLDLFYIFLALIVVVWGSKQLLKLFEVNHDGD
jgi:TRAP-type C4-dicarboxylate transport system permease small subunit